MRLEFGESALWLYRTTESSSGQDLVNVKNRGFEISEF